MAAGVTIVDPATTWVQSDVVVGPDTVLHPGVYLEGQTRIGSGCEIHSGVRIIDSTVGDGVVINNFCVIRQSAIESGRGRRTVRPAQAGVEGRRERTRRQLRRAEEHDARPRVEGEPPRVSRRRDDRREGQRRRRHDHVQLRRRQQAPDGHRGWRVHRLRQPAHRAGARREERLRRRRVVDHRRRAARRAGDRARQAGEQARLDRARQAQARLTTGVD